MPKERQSVTTEKFEKSEDVKMEEEPMAPPAKKDDFCRPPDVKDASIDPNTEDLVADLDEIDEGEESCGDLP